MAPLPSNNTAVLYIDYTTGARQHTFQCRYIEATPANAILAVGSFLDALKLVLTAGWRVLAARTRAVGAVITLPTTLSPFLTSFAGDSGQGLDGFNEAREFVWVGRGLQAGRRVEVSLYGLVLGTPNDYRYEAAGGPPSLANARTQLGVAPNTFSTVSGEAALWYPYVNVNYNSYWESRSRA